MWVSLTFTATSNAYTVTSTAVCWQWCVVPFNTLHDKQEVGTVTDTTLEMKNLRETKG